MAPNNVTSGVSTRIFVSVLILVVTTLAWFWLSDLALHARENESGKVAKSSITQDYDKAKTWATDILGLAATLAGFFGVASAARNDTRLNSLQRAEKAEGGMVGILAGATLLGVGGWATSIGLVAVSTGVTARLFLAARAGLPAGEKIT